MKDIHVERIAPVTVGPFADWYYTGYEWVVGKGDEAYVEFTISSRVDGKLVEQKNRERRSPEHALPLIRRMEGRATAP